MSSAVDKTESVVVEPTRKPIKSERTRAAILNAALAFLWEHPFRELSVKVLMADLPMGRSVFYQYFDDIYALMQTLLDDLAQSIFDVATPWFDGGGNRKKMLEVSLESFVDVCYERGPLLRAVADAAVGDERMEKSWNQFLGSFDVAVAEQIEADQAAGLTPAVDAMALSKALTRMSAGTFVSSFGKHPRDEPGPVLDAIKRIYLAALYAKR